MQHRIKFAVKLRPRHKEILPNGENLIQFTETLMNIINPIINY